MLRNRHCRRGSTTLPEREEVETGNPSSEGDQTTYEDHNIVYPETAFPLVCYLVLNTSNTVC